MPLRDPRRRTTRTGRLLDRVIQQRRDAKKETGSDADESDAGEVDDELRIAALERRVEQLEALLEGLQDSVHRETTRQAREIEALTARTKPPEMARALDKYSRERGL